MILPFKSAHRQNRSQWLAIRVDVDSATVAWGWVAPEYLPIWWSVKFGTPEVVIPNRPFCINPSGWWQLKYFLNFHPWGPNGIQFLWLAHIFQMGWLLKPPSSIPMHLKKIPLQVPTIDPSKIVAGTESQRTPDQVSCDRAIRYSGFFGVRETWVRLEISWNWRFFRKTTLVWDHFLTRDHSEQLQKMHYDCSFMGLYNPCHTVDGRNPIPNHLRCC